MKLRDLNELLEGYSGDAEVVIVDRSDPCVNRYYQIVGVDVQDWGTRFEIVMKRETVQATDGSETCSV